MGGEVRKSNVADAGGVCDIVCFQSSALWAVSNSHAKSGLSQTFGTYCWADLADLSVT